MAKEMTHLVAGTGPKSIVERGHLVQESAYSMGGASGNKLRTNKLTVRAGYSHGNGHGHVSR